MKPVSEKNNFVYMTVGIVLLFFFAALVDQSGFLSAHLIQEFSVINILVGLYGFKQGSLWLQSKLGKIVIVTSVIFLGAFLEYFKLSYLHLIVLFLFYLWAIWLAMRQVLFTGAIDVNKIVGAICIYLLLGMLWALMYLFIAEAIPGAFIGLEQLVWYDNFANVVYYSFVTLTTLGYGDISPIAPVARFLVYMEAVVGVFYMAILVASLIGVSISDHKRTID